MARRSLDAILQLRIASLRVRRDAKRADRRRRELSITLRLDASVVERFKARWPHGGCQTAINNVLKAYI